MTLAEVTTVDSRQPVRERLGARRPDRSSRHLAALAILAVLAVAAIRVTPWGLLLPGAVALFVLARQPGWLMATAVVGIFPYQVLLRLGGERPHSALTAAYYVGVGGTCVVVAWRRRDLVRDALRDRLTRFWLLAAAFLAVWFVGNALLLGSGRTAQRFAALLVVAALPAAALAFTADRALLAQLRRGLLAIGIVCVVADVVALGAGVRASGVRFSPFAALDPINAAIVPALAVLAVLASSRLWWKGAAVAVGAALLTATLLTGSRGPVLGIAFGVACLVLLLGRRFPRRGVVLLTGVLVAGGAAGIVASHAVGTGAAWGYIAHQGQAPTIVTPPTAPAGGEKGGGKAGGEKGGKVELHPGVVTSERIRLRWMEEALKQSRHKLVLGHGVSQLVDRTPEAYQMGIAGERVWPHNEPVEALFSLGLPGLAAYLAFVLVPVWYLVRRRTPADALVVALMGFAIAEANLSGEIGTDVLLWVLCALALAPRRRAEPAV